MESSTSSEEVPSLQSASVKTSGMLAVMNMARDVNNFLHSGSEGFVMLDETMSTGVSYDNDGFDVTAERPDLEDVNEAFPNLKSKLFFGTQEQLEETALSVGPQEYLDKDIYSKIEVVENSLKSGRDDQDDVPQKVLDIIHQVVTMASQGNTSTFAASSILDTTHKAFEYGRWATQNQFMLSGLSDTTLDAYDHAFTQFIDFRRVGELEKSNMLSAQCFELLEKAAKQVRKDQGSLHTRLNEEGHIASAEDLTEVEATAKEELQGERDELEKVRRDSKNDMEKIDKELDRLVDITSSAKQDYTRRKLSREDKLVKNRKEQERHRMILRQLETEEKELVRVSEEEEQLQTIADEQFEQTQRNIWELKEKIETLKSQADTSLTITESMNVVTNIILTDAKQKKRSWLQKLAQMELKNLLQLRDVLIATACINNMTSDDCNNNLTETDKLLTTLNEDRIRAAQTGFGERVKQIQQQIEEYRKTRKNYEDKVKHHNAIVTDQLQQLAEVDSRIRALNANIRLDSYEDRYHLLLSMRKKVFTEDNIQVAKFCSHGNYQF